MNNIFLQARTVAEGNIGQYKNPEDLARLPSTLPVPENIRIVGLGTKLDTRVTDATETEGICAQQSGHCHPEILEVISNYLTPFNFRGWPKIRGAEKV